MEVQDRRPSSRNQENPAMPFIGYKRANAENPSRRLGATRSLGGKNVKNVVDVI
jgi:hypothetical protein